MKDMENMEGFMGRGEEVCVLDVKKQRMTNGVVACVRNSTCAFTASPRWPKEVDKCEKHHLSCT